VSVVAAAYGRYTRKIAAADAYNSRSRCSMTPAVGCFVQRGDGDASDDRFSHRHTTEGSARQHERGIARAMNVGVLLAREEHGHAEAKMPPGDAISRFPPGLKAPPAGDRKATCLNQKNSSSPSMTQRIRSD